MDLTKKVKVWNRSNSGVSYTIPELRISRRFEPAGLRGDMVMIPLGELQSLSYEPGGKLLLDSYLLIKEQEVCDFLGLQVEPEYFYGVDQVKYLLKEGSVEQLKDCLEFAPSGVLELIKQYAVQEEIDSHEKRTLIGNTLKISIDSMIRNNKLSKTEDGDNGAAEFEQTRRRTKPIEVPKETPAPAAPKYNRVNK